MPYDPSLVPVLEAVASGQQRFRDALRVTADDLGRFLGENDHGGGDTAGDGLGPFGNVHIDRERWQNIFRPSGGPDVHETATLERSLAVLNELTAEGDDLFLTRVLSDQAVDVVVRDALARAGRAFGAARVAVAVRAHRYRVQEHARSLVSFPFAKWNRAERDLAPPLIVTVPGEALRGGALVEFLDGRAKIVLVVTGPCAPAPLARVIAPSVLVQQVTRPEDLTLDRFDGPALAAVMPEGAAVFTHDPARAAAGDPPLDIRVLPPVVPRKPVGGLSGTQQNDELQMLGRMASSQAVLSPAPSQAEPPLEPADRLAAWLLSSVEVEVDQ